MTPHLALGEDYSLDDGFCDSAFGCAQNDSIAGGVQVSYRNKRSSKSFACGVDFDHLALPSYVPLPIKG